MKRPIRVFFFIDISHPYIKMLIRHLSSNPFLKIFHFNKSTRKEFPRRLKDIVYADIIHFHWIDYLIRSNNVIITWLLIIFWLLFIGFFKKLGKKIIVTLHDIHPRDHKFPVPVYHFFTKFLSAADLIIAHNNFTVKFARPFYRIQQKEFEIIPHGSFREYYESKELEIIEIDKLSEYPLKILFLGNLRRYKGLEKLIYVINRMANNPNVFFLIAGRCMDISICNQITKLNKIAKNFHLIPKFLSDGEILYLLNLCDVGIIPYRTTTTPGSMILFLSFGKPVIVPKKEPLIEYCNEARACYMYREDSWREDLIKILNDIIEKREELTLLSKNALKYSSKLSWRKISYITVKAYLKTLKSVKSV